MSRSEGAGRRGPGDRLPPRVLVGRWGWLVRGGVSGVGGALLRARPRQSQAPLGGARARRAREEGRAGRRSRPIWAPRLHDVRLSRAPSASRRAWPVSARARGRAGARVRGAGLPASPGSGSCVFSCEREGALGRRSREVETFSGPKREGAAAVCRQPAPCRPPPLVRAGRAPAPAPPSRPVRVWRGRRAPGLRRSAAGRRRR